ncbi:hypothetical protein [Bdellovibrio bacteriovorus]|uniref:Uncharacterized protein n=1 Tax=Bdellovibrio bacteriovorus str. Tiberius TaxID=1069642 RepID=K7YSL9_BDEBC|nr:hypothetical protein [Bdellovibrio bacteriovorus]AFY02881.1 hypothetical protein Bdt_3206 [Bdellovibrio bacteriovorus str. Tiberius]
MRKFFAASLLCLVFCINGGRAQAQTIDGAWLAENYISGGQGYPGLFRSWYVFAADHVDRVISLGAHYYKVKYQIQKSDGRQWQLVNLETGLAETLTITEQNPDVQICLGNGDCALHTRVAALPDFYLPEGPFPAVSLSAEWCVNSDCAMIEYSDYQAEQLFNRRSDFYGISYRYDAPDELEERHGIRMFVGSTSYRLENRPDRLDSFSTMLNFTANPVGSGQVAEGQTPVLRLQEGSFASLKVSGFAKDMSVRFILKQKKQGQD